jgi:hypothetical protein
MQINYKTRTLLTPYLKKGWRSKVAHKVGVHENTVSNVFNGHTDNPDVAEAILSYVEEIKARQKRLEERASKLGQNHDANLDSSSDTGNEE